MENVRKATITKDEFYMLFQPNKMVAQVKDGEHWIPIGPDEFPLYLEPDAERNHLVLTGVKRIPRATMKNLVLKAGREDESVSMRMVCFLLNPRSDQGYCVVSVYDKTTGKRDTVELIWEGVGIYYAPPSAERANLFRDAQTVLANIDWSFVESGITDEEEEENLDFLDNGEEI